MLTDKSSPLNPETILKTVLYALLTLAFIVGPAGADPLSDLNRLYAHERFGEAADLCADLLVQTPDDPTFVHLTGRILADTFDFAAAAPYLEQGLSPDAPGWIPGWSHLYLGICALNLGDPEAARRHWEDVITGSSTANAHNTASLYLACHFDGPLYFDWIARDTEHFEFRFSPAIENLDYDAFAIGHESVYAFISAWCGAGEDRPIRYFVWDPHEVGRAAGLPRIGFNYARISLVHVRKEQTSGHEMAHVLSVRTLKPKRICGLIAEGLAVFLDMSGDDRSARVRTALREYGAPVTIDALWNDWGGFPEAVSYQVAGAFVEMLVNKGGRELFLELFRDQGLERARRIYGDDLDGWISEFESGLSR